MFIDAQRQEADDIGGNAHLAFHLGNCFMRRVDVYQGEMGFAVFLDLVAEIFDAPAFGFIDRAAIVLDDGLVGFKQALELLRGNILAAKEYMFVERHEMSPFLVQNYGPAQSLFEP